MLRSYVIVVRNPTLRQALLRSTIRPTVSVHTVEILRKLGFRPNVGP